MTFEEAVEKIGRRAYQIEMAEGMIPAADSGASWDRYMERCKSREIGGYGGSVVGVHHIVMSTLMAAQELGLLAPEVER